MAGANGVPKFEQVDRENEILQLKYVGPSSQTLNQYTIPSLGLFTGLNPTNPNGYPTSWAAGILTQNWLITGSTPNPLTGPTGAQAYTQFGASLGNANPVGQTYIQSVQNSTGAPVVINFASGFTPSTLTIPANTTEYLQWECTAPDTFVLFYESAFPPTAGGGTVTSITAGTGITLTPNPITTTGTVAITNTAVTPGTYTFMDATVNAQGQITAAGSGQLLGTAGEITVTPSGAFPTNGYTLSLPASGATAGTYPFADVTVNASGVITAISAGTSPYGLIFNPPFNTAAVQLSWLSLSIVGSASPGTSVAAGQPVTLAAVGGPGTNDSTTYTFTGTQVTIRKIGDFFFSTNFSQAGGQPSTWVLTDGVSLPGTPISNNFGNADTVGTAVTGVQNCTNNFIFTVSSVPTTIQLINNSSPATAQSLIVKAGAVNTSTTGSGFFTLIRLD